MSVSDWGGLDLRPDFDCTVCREEHGTWGFHLRYAGTKTLLRSSALWMVELVQVVLLGCRTVNLERAVVTAVVSRESRAAELRRPSSEAVILTLHAFFKVFRPAVSKQCPIEAYDDLQS